MLFFNTSLIGLVLLRRNENKESEKCDEIRSVARKLYDTHFFRLPTTIDIIPFYSMSFATVPAAPNKLNDERIAIKKTRSLFILLNLFILKINLNFQQTKKKLIKNQI